MRILFCAALLTALSTETLFAAGCCPHNRVGTDAASVCPACGRATILGVSIPWASAVGALRPPLAAGCFWRLAVLAAVRKCSARREERRAEVAALR